MVAGNDLCTEYGIKLLRRPLINNRDEDVSREVYSGGMVEEGYSSNARSPTVLVEVT